MRMEGLGEFFLGPFWAALTGTVGLLSAVVPVIIKMSKKVERRRAELQPVRQPMKIGCGSVAVSGSLNAVAYILYGVLINGFALTILGFSPSHLRADYWSAIGKVYRFDSFLDTMTAGCGAMCLALSLLFSLYSCSTVAAARYGYEYGIYGLVLGTSAIGFPLNLALVSSIPAYATLPSTSKLYIVAVSTFSSLLASLVVLAVTWFILRSIYRPGTVMHGIPPAPLDSNRV